MIVTADMVKELRERTGSGMMECKKALVAAEGDIDKAIEDMRKSGAAKADKKAGRIAAEGRIGLSSDDKGQRCVVIEVNSETDFVARDANFVEFVDQMTQRALESSEGDLTALLQLPMAVGSDMSLDDARKALITKIGENIHARRLSLSIAGADEVLGSYRHGDRIGVVVHLKGGDQTLAKDIAMHIAASRPVVVSAEQVPEALIEQEKSIFAAQAEQSGKPADIIDKMIQGRIKKFLDEVSLLGQPYVKDPALTVGQLVKNAGATVLSFARFEVGEGIEKKEDNFVEEVMAQARGQA